MSKLSNILFYFFYLYFLKNLVEELSVYQNVNGAFYPSNCLDKKMKIHCKKDRSIFFTGIIAESLSQVPEAKNIYNESRKYLENQFIQQNGVLRYFEKDSSLYKMIKPDADTNSIIYSTLISKPDLTENVQKRFPELYKITLKINTF